MTSTIGLLALWSITSALSAHASTISGDNPTIRNPKTQQILALYPTLLDELPDMPSPFTAEDGTEVVIAAMSTGKYILIPVTVEDGEPLNYRERQLGKGKQTQADEKDFPTLAKRGLHSEIELDQTKTITGRSTSEITEDGRPGGSSGAGFMHQDEDIISVLKGDNRLVRKLGLTHPDAAKPLFHVWNLILSLSADHWENILYILYNDKKVRFRARGSKGWQESLFSDEILGRYQLEMRREMDATEMEFLQAKYRDDPLSELVKLISNIQTGEMVPYYITRYGFYEGHTSYRADPIAIAFIFNLRSLEEIDTAFGGDLYRALTETFTRQPASSGERK
jgi:hypothetical protein